jgi:hypothetical protein
MAYCLFGKVAKVVATREGGGCDQLLPERATCLGVRDHSVCPDDVGLMVSVKPHGQ